MKTQGIRFNEHNKPEEVRTAQLDPVKILTARLNHVHKLAVSNRHLNKS